MTEVLSKLTIAAVKELYNEEILPTFSRPDEAHGDYATNVALQLAGKLGKNPREVAESIAEKLGTSSDLHVSVAGPGFINIILPDHDVFNVSLEADQLEKPLQEQVIVAEYSDPNPFKVLHAGHLYTTLVGDAISNILEIAGADVKRVNFGGDVGMHVAKAMWGILQELGGENPDKLDQISVDKRPEWISECYVAGNTAYESDEYAKADIVDINRRVYGIHAENDETSPFAQIYWATRRWSYDGFDQLYEDLQVKPFDKYYPESQTAPIGAALVQEGLEKGYFENSKGAVVYRGEREGLHTRVFMTAAGLPTYEAKDLGVAESKWRDYSFDQSVIITGDDIIEYMKVVVAVLKNFHPDIAERTRHLTHGMIKLAGGKKMSSREGSVVLASEILEAAFAANKAATDKDDAQVVLGAVRYSFLKNRVGGDIIYDPKESVSLDGNSGPYLQYALVRARSILRKIEVHADTNVTELDEAERSLARKLTMYQEAFDLSLQDYSPHHICTYLYELSQVFNRFYEQSRVIDDPRSGLRSQLVAAYERVLAHGLGVLGMPTPEEM